MQYRIMYCDKCGKEYQNVLDKYGEKCDNCKNQLKTAWKVIEKEYSCIKLIEKCREVS